MKLGIATPINLEKEPTIHLKLVEAAQGIQVKILHEYGPEHIDGSILGTFAVKDDKIEFLRALYTSTTYVAQDPATGKIKVN